MRRFLGADAPWLGFCRQLPVNGKKGFFVKFYGFFTKTTARPPLRSDELWVSPFSRSGGRGKPNDQAAQGFSEN